MRLPLSWIRDFVDEEIEPEKLAELLTLSGTKVDEILSEGEDTAFEFEITPNRADCFSVYGVAREIAALTDQELKPLETQLHYVEGEPKHTVSLTPKAKDLVLSYALGVFENITITQSPEKIRDRLRKAGMRPIDSVVDVTNYVMLETGQPNHAFDYDKITDHRMTLRASQKGESVTTLDNVKRTLPEGSIIIEDSEKLIDLAGLMGGQNTEIDKSTTKVALLVPIYHPVKIRRTSLATGLRTEASSRFEKNLDPPMVKDAFYRIARLLFETSGARLSSEVTIFHQDPVELRTIEVTLTQIEEYLGITVLGEDLVNYLTPLGFLVKHLPQEASDKFAITAPSWRKDVVLPVDVIEEVARLYGYNNFAKTLPSGELPTHRDNFTPDWERIVKEYLVSLGLTEVAGYTLLSETLIRKALFQPEKIVKIINPNSVDFVYLRPSLLPTLLQALSLNLKNYPQVNLFEIGKVFGESTKDLPLQDRQLAILSNQDFRSLKGYILALAQKLNLELSFRPLQNPSFEAGGGIYLGAELVGEIGSLNLQLLTSFDIPNKAAFAHLDFEKLIKMASLEAKYTPLPKFPEVKEDLAIIVDEKVTTEEILTLIQKTGKPLLQRVAPFDYYTGGKIGEGKKSIAFSLAYGANKTLTNEEVAKVLAKITKILEKDLKAEIR